MKENIFCDGKRGLRLIFLWLLTSGVLNYFCFRFSWNMRFYLSKIFKRLNSRLKVIHHNLLSPLSLSLSSSLHTALDTKLKFPYITHSLFSYANSHPPAFNLSLLRNPLCFWQWKLVIFNKNSPFPSSNVTIAASAKNFSLLSIKIISALSLSRSTLSLFLYITIH